jgi:hypothetical protein
MHCQKSYEKGRMPYETLDIERGPVQGSEHGECEGEAPAGFACGGGDPLSGTGVRPPVNLNHSHGECEGEAPAGFACGGGDVSPRKLNKGGLHDS